MSCMARGVNCASAGTQMGLECVPEIRSGRSPPGGALGSASAGWWLLLL